MVDKEYCVDCVNFKRCKWLIGAKESWDKCDWNPSKYEKKKPSFLDGLLDNGYPE